MTLGGRQVINSPVPLLVLAARARVDHFQVSGTGRDEAVAGQLARFVVAPFDAFDNPIRPPLARPLSASSAARFGFVIVDPTSGSSKADADGSSIRAGSRSKAAASMSPFKAIAASPALAYGKNGSLGQRAPAPNVRPLTRRASGEICLSREVHDSGETSGDAAISTTAPATPAVRAAHASSTERRTTHLKSHEAKFVAAHAGRAAGHQSTRPTTTSSWHQEHPAATGVDPSAGQSPARLKPLEACSVLRGERVAREAGRDVMREDAWRALQSMSFDGGWDEHELCERARRLSNRSPFAPRARTLDPA